MPGEDDGPATVPTGKEPAHGRPDSTVVDEDDLAPANLGPRIEVPAPTRAPAPVEPPTTVGPAPAPTARSRAGLPQVPPRRLSRGELPGVTGPPAAEAPVGRRATKGELPQVTKPPSSSRAGLPGVKGPPRRASVASMPAASVPEGHRPTRPGAEVQAAERQTEMQEPLLGTPDATTDRRPLAAAGTQSTEPGARGPGQFSPLAGEPGPTANERGLSGVKLPAVRPVPLAETPTGQQPLGAGVPESSTDPRTDLREQLGGAGTVDPTGPVSQVTQPPQDGGNARTTGYASLKAKARARLPPLFSQRALLILVAAAGATVVVAGFFIAAPGPGPDPGADLSAPKPLARPRAPLKAPDPAPAPEAAPRPEIVLEETVDAGAGYTRQVEREAGSVRIVTTPPMAVSASADGGVLGTTPIVLTFPTGEVELTLTNADEGLVRKERFEVLPGLNTPRLFEYRKGRLEVHAPSGSVVFLGKKKLGRAPLKQLALWAGTYEIEVRPPRRAPVKRRVQVLDGETSTFEVEERPLEAE